MEALKLLFVWIVLASFFWSLQGRLGLAHPLVGLFLWLGLRSQISEPFQQVWMGLWRRSGAALRLLVREGALALWFTLSWMGVVPGDLLAWTVPPVAAASGMFLLALIVMYREGAPEARPEALPRWLLILPALLTLGTGLAGPWNTGIAMLARSPMDLGHVLRGLAAAGVLAVLCVVHNVLWATRSPWLNGLALRLLRSLLERETFVRWYLRVRHLGHRIGRSWLIRIILVLRDLVESFFGRPPAWLFPRPHATDRLELLFRARLWKADADVEARFLSWSAGRLRSGGSSSADDLTRALHQRAQLLLLLCDHLLCPFEPCRVGWSLDVLRDLAERIDRHLLRVRRVGVPVASEVEALLRERLGRYQLERGEGMLQPPPPDGPAGDLERLRQRDELAAWLRTPSRAGQDLAVHRLLTGLVVEKDWAGVIEVERLLERTTSYVLAPEDHRDCGEAWAGYAGELGAGPLSLWAFEKAASYYYRAQAREHLDALADRVARSRGESHAA